MINVMNKHNTSYIYRCRTVLKLTGIDIFAQLIFQLQLTLILIEIGRLN